MTNKYMVKIKKPYDVHARVKQHTGEFSRTQQNLKDECDVNIIMKKYQKTGVLTHVREKAGQYGDFSEVPDYKAGIERIMAADALFAELPAKIRDRFSNDPSEFIEFASNPENLDEMRTLGLAPAKQVPQPSTVEVPAAPPAKPDPSPKAD